MSEANIKQSMSDKFEIKINKAYSKVSTKLDFLKIRLTELKESLSEDIKELRKLEYLEERNLLENDRLMELCFSLGKRLGEMEMQYKVSQLAIIELE